MTTCFSGIMELASTFEECQVGGRKLLGVVCTAFLNHREQKLGQMDDESSLA
jgi:hypothetical protein